MSGIILDRVSNTIIQHNPHTENWSPEGKTTCSEICWAAAEENRQIPLANEQRLASVPTFSVAAMGRNQQLDVAVVGAGWYGCHIAIELSQIGHHVRLVEKENEILSRCSGTFGIRLHRGPHYPRSPATRRNCQTTFDRFIEAYPELVYWHDESIYAYGLKDAQGYPSKTSLQAFEDVCFETKSCRRIDAKTRYTDVAAAFDLAEPSIATGAELRRCIQARLAQTDVQLSLNIRVQDVHSNSEGVTLCLSQTGENWEQKADFVINATGYQTLLEERLQISRTLYDLSVVYQACIAFKYEDQTPGLRPISFIVMDGWFPCLMPKIGDRKGFKDYVLTHGCYTILGSYKQPKSAHAVLRGIQPSTLEKLQRASEHEMCRFWPAFKERFTYSGWESAVLAKPRSGVEFRSSLTFAKGRIVYVIPGKISNVFTAYDEVLELLDTARLVHDGVQIAETGTLRASVEELQPSALSVDPRSTHNLQTLQRFCS